VEIRSKKRYYETSFHSCLQKFATLQTYWIICEEFRLSSISKLNAFSLLQIFVTKNFREPTVIVCFLFLRYPTCYSERVQEHLESLNTQQKEAVLHVNSPLLILAGAGAGKTKTITHRILHLIKSGIPPQEIMAVTFTNKAAKEMRDRVMSLIKKDKELNSPILFTETPFVSTFHSLGVHILKENARLLGLTRHFTIFDRSDSLSAVREAVRETSLDPKQYDPGKFLRAISREKGDMITVEEYATGARKEYWGKLVISVWQKYEAALRKENALDFDDLLLKTALLLKDHKEVLGKYQSVWKYIHIDEYQDTNRVQYMIAKMLSAKERHICVVGDIDQNIYSWRGADIRNILEFEKDYPDARTVLLEENYRSTQTILETANKVIAKNKKRREKNLFTRAGWGEKIALFEGYDEIDEAHFTATKSKELIAAGTNPNEISLLYRANFQSRALEEAFLAHGVPYQVLGVKFFERKEVKDVLSYLRVALNPQSLSDMKRVVNVPPRGIGKVTLLKIFSGAESNLPVSMKDKLGKFRILLSEIRVDIEKEKASTVLKNLVVESGLESLYKNGTEEDIERLENLYELVTLASKYDLMTAPLGIEKLLEDAALATDQDEMEEEKKGVKLMTVHAAKGLEFDIVFITGLEENLFPHKNLSEESMTEDKAEEERRLFYVALTRARKKLFLTLASVRTIFGSKRLNVPSEFLSDIDEKLIEAVTPPPEGPRREKIIWFD